MRRTLILMLSAVTLITASCSKTGESPEEMTKQTCVLTNLKESDGPSATFAYNSQGKVSTYSYTTNNVASPYDYSYIYTYTGTAITEQYTLKTTSGTVSRTTTYSIDNNGRVTSASYANGNSTYTTGYKYDPNGYLIEINEPNATRQLTWANGNITQSNTNTIQYSNEEYPSNFYNEAVGIPKELTFVLKTYFGKALKNLPSMLLSGSSNYQYTYTKDGNGNIASLSDKYMFNGSTLVTNYTYSCK